jgi:CheY-like chemotaxis protein
MLNPNATTPCGILYIDDEEKALKYFRMAFGQKYQVFTASSGTEGLEILRRETGKIGIVISDQRMPGMLGAEVLGVARQEFPQVVRLLTTAYSDLDSAIQAVNKGHIYQYVVKPWEIPDLGMVLQRAADYFQVMAERNELLSLKMGILQRLVCGDRLKALLLAVRGWPEDRRAAMHRALAALVEALPSSLASFPVAPREFVRRDFSIEALLLDGFAAAARVLDSLDEGGGDSAVVLAGGLGGNATAESPEGWTIELAHGPDLAALCGVIVERTPSPAAVLVLKALFHLASSGGRLRILREGAPLVDFAPRMDVPTAEEMLDTLGGKYAQWDIHGR